MQGLTLFTGVQATLDILPALAGTGIRFRRIDLPGSPEIPARVSHVVPENRRTVLAADPSEAKSPSVQTVEHVLSALAGLGVRDAVLELAGPELPIGDGSAQLFTDALMPAVRPGSTVGSAERFATLNEPIIIADGSARIEAHPSDTPGTTLEYHLQYPPGCGIEPQSATLHVAEDGTVENYTREIAPARTFSLLAEAKAARAMGLFMHLSPKDTLVIAPEGPIDNDLRFPNEPARHKLLDLLGDLSLAGRNVQCRIIATRTGHAHNHAMARALSGGGQRAEQQMAKGPN